MTTLPRGNRSFGCGLPMLKTRLGPGCVIAGSATGAGAFGVAGRALELAGGRATASGAGGAATTAGQQRHR